MRSPGLSWAAPWVALAVLGGAQGASLRTPLEASVLLETTAQTSLSAAFLRATPGIEDVSPQKVATLEQEVAGLEADKKGLVIAVRRLLKANQTESQKQMLSALRAAKLQAEAAAKKLEDEEQADRAQLKKAKELQQGTEEKLVEEMGQVRGLQQKETSEEADLAALRKKDEDESNGIANLEAEEGKLKEQNAKLQEEKRGLEATVQKLWTSNASTGAKTMLKMLGAEAERLKVVSSTRQTEENQFAQEKNELSRRLSEAEHKHEADVQTANSLRADNLKLRLAFKNKASLEAETHTKAVEDLQAQNKQLTGALSKQKFKEAAELKVAHDREAALQGKLDKDSALSEKLKKANAELLSASVELKAETEKLKAAKDADENIYAQALTDLQTKVNQSEALVRQKDDEIKEVSTRGMESYAKNYAKIQTSLEQKLAAEKKDNDSLEKKLADLSLAEKARADELAKLSENGNRMRALLTNQKQKLTYALDKENTEMLRVDKLEAEKTNLTAELQKAREFEPKLTKLQKEHEALKASNLKLEAGEKAARAQLVKMQEASQQVSQNVVQVRNKLDFAVDQENTQMIAVKILQSQNAKLKEALQNQTELQARLKREDAQNKEQEGSMMALEGQKVKAEANLTALLGQIATLKRANVQLQDEFDAERKKRQEAADQFGEESLALKMLQGQNQKLKEQLQRDSEDEAAMMNVVNVSRAKAAAAEMVETQGNVMRAEVAASRQKEEVLRHHNDQLQETIVSMAARIRELELEQKLTVTPKIEYVVKDEPRPVQREVSNPNNLEQQQVDLSNLVSQLHEINIPRRPPVIKEADDA